MPYLQMTQASCLLLALLFNYLLLGFLTVQARAAQVYVDARAGNDSLCSSLQDLLLDGSDFQLASSNESIPCRTINRALGDVACSLECESDFPLYDSTVRLSDGIHTLSGCIAIVQGGNITIEAENTGMATIQCQSFGELATAAWDPIEVCKTRGLVFRGINFENCGPIAPNVFLNRTNHVLFEDCVFRNNIGPTLRLQFVPSVTLYRTDFISNSNQSPAPEDSESTTIEQLFDSITTAGGFTYFSRDRSVSITIDECRFINNTASTNNEEDTRPLLWKANGHGGAVLIRLAAIDGGSIRITNSLFHGNKAEIDGGGIYFFFSDGFSSNIVYLFNNTFELNSVQKSSGGAVSWNSITSSYNNSLVLKDCEFRQNKGNAGGAVSLSVYDTGIVSVLLPDKAEFIRCLFEENVASFEGTAVGLFALVRVEEFGYPVNFIDCNFTRNAHSSNHTQSEYTGALLAFRFPMNFRGSNLFVENVGGGIVLLDSRLNLVGSLLLQENQAIFGAGISMDDSCLIELNPGATLTFVNNTAQLSGGGMHVTFPAVRLTTPFFNRQCFIQYNSSSGRDQPPHLWKNVAISFIGNKAGNSGAAMFASDISVCSWIGNEYPSNLTTIFGPHPPGIADLSPFHYENNTLLTVTNQTNPNLATAPHRIFVLPVLQSEVVQSGEKVQFNILIVDQLNNSREAVWSLQAPNQEPIFDGNSADNNTFVYTLPAATLLIDDVKVCAKNISGSFRLDFTLPNTLGESTSLTFDLSGCHPGYSKDTATCLCQCENMDNSDIIRCDQNYRYIYLRNGLWGGVDNSSGTRELVTAKPPGNYLNCTTVGSLSGCLFEWDNPSAQCRRGRHGPLCGKCDGGYGVTMDLLTCSNAQNNCVFGLSVFVLLCIGVIAASVFILFFNVGIPNELKGLFFYLQVIGLIFRQSFVIKSSDTSSLHNSLSVVTNLLGVSLPFPLCISPNLQAQHIAILGYVSPMLVLCTVIVYIISARFIKVLSNRSSLEGITLLSLLFYKYMAETCFTVMNCTNTSNGFVFTYNGSVYCRSWEFGIFVILAILMVLFFVLPAPFAVTYICIKRPARFQQYADVLTKEIHAHHRWFGGWDIGRRLLFVFFSFMPLQPTVILLLMCLSATSILLIHLLVKPYEKQHVNIIEGLVLINLAVVTVIFLNSSANGIPEWIGTLLLLLPYFFGVFYIICSLLLYAYKRYSKKCEASGKRNIFLMEKSFQVGKKKLAVGVKDSMFVRLLDSSNEESEEAVNKEVTDDELYDRERHSAYRDSILETTRT